MASAIVSADLRSDARGPAAHDRDGRGVRDVPPPRARGGLFVGPSSGANVAAALRVAREAGSPGRRTVVDDPVRRRRAAISRGPSGGRVIRVAADAASRRSARTAGEAYPEECCGALLGESRGGGESATRGRARRERRPRRAAAALPDRRRATTAAWSGSPRPGGMALVGFYHSHPDHPAARPSTTGNTRCRSSIMLSWRSRAGRARGDDVLGAFGGPRVFRARGDPDGRDEAEPNHEE